MDPITWGFIGTLIGTIVGASASIITTIINAKNLTKNQRNLENYKRKENFREFQRNNYLNVQEIFPRVMRLASLILLEDMKNYKKTGEWQKSSIDHENDNNLMMELRKLNIHIERIQNENLREELKRFIVKVSSVSMTSNLAKSNAIMAELASKDYDRIMVSLGKELRKNY
jgi:gas vesicle protein